MKLVKSRKTFLGYTNLSTDKSLANLSMEFIAVSERKVSVWSRQRAARSQQQETAYSEEIPDNVQMMWQMTELHKHTTRKIRTISRQCGACVKKVYHKGLMSMFVSRRADSVSRIYLHVLKFKSGGPFPPPLAEHDTVSAGNLLWVVQLMGKGPPSCTQWKNWIYSQNKIDV